MAAAPAITKFVGGTPALATQTTLEMYEITFDEHEQFTIPALDFRGTPCGIDVRRVIETGILPSINTGIAHREPGVGMVGAGILRAPEGCFLEAFEALMELTRFPGRAADRVGVSPDFDNPQPDEMLKDFET
jgi:hypothetical protein